MQCNTDHVVRCLMVKNEKGLISGCQNWIDEGAVHELHIGDGEDGIMRKRRSCLCLVHKGVGWQG